MPIRRLLNLVSVVLYTALFLSCNDTNKKEQLLIQAGANRGELEKLLSYYPKGSQKSKAVDFILENIGTHTATVGESVDNYRTLLLSIDTVINVQTPDIIDSLWKISNAENSPVNIVPHAEILSAEYLIDDIDAAFEIWNKSAWKDSVSFKIFKQYILPYTVSNESITSWRVALYNKYYKLIENITSPKEAFDKVYTHIVNNFKLGETLFPYTRDPMIIDKTMRGVCDDRSLYIVAVMRSLCIPAAFDFTKIWANYSNVGHSWAIYVGDGSEIYNIASYDSVSYKNGVMDGTIWEKQYSFDDSGTDYIVDSMKKVSKIMRRVYGTEGGSESAMGTNAIDVSRLHGLTNSIKIKTDKKNSEVCLCTFRSGGNWVPIDASAQRSKRRTFKNLGGDITYLPVYYTDEYGMEEPVCNPITVYSDGRKVSRNPDTENTEQVVLRRKYLLLTLWAPNRWMNYIGFTFEGSDFPDFSVSDTLHLVENMPIGVTHIDIDTNKPYRYLRVRPRYKTRHSMNEAAFFGRDENGDEIEMKGDIIYSNIEEQNARQLFDKDYITGTYTKSAYSWVGYDLGPDNKIKVSKLTYLPWNDGNFIEPGDEYELFYYDLGWHSLGKQVAREEYLIYDNVPKNAVLWLRDITKGSEERIFTYENGKQVWW